MRTFLKIALLSLLFTALGALAQTAGTATAQDRRGLDGTASPDRSHSTGYTLTITPPTVATGGTTMITNASDRDDD